jgi:hypothetical protein
VEKIGSNFVRFVHLVWLISVLNYCFVASLRAEDGQRRIGQKNAESVLDDSLIQLFFEIQKEIPRLVDWRFGWWSSYTLTYFVIFDSTYNYFKQNSDGNYYHYFVNYYEKFEERQFNLRVLDEFRLEEKIKSISMNYLDFKLDEILNKKYNNCHIGRDACDRDWELFQTKKKEFVKNVLFKSNFDESRLTFGEIKYRTVWTIEAPTMLRPLIVRLLIFLIQFTEFAWIVMLAGQFFGLRNSAEQNFVFNQIAALFFLFSVDYAASRLDYILNAETFRTFVEHQVNDAKFQVRDNIIHWADDQSMTFLQNTTKF